MQLLCENEAQLKQINTNNSGHVTLLPEMVRGQQRNSKAEKD